MFTSKQPDESPTKPAPPKRSLFNKPSWSKPVAADPSTDLFRRSSARYTEVVQEQEQRRARRKAARLERERQRQGGDDEERGGKRRRISEKYGDDDDDDSSSGSEHERGQDELGRPYVVTRVLLHQQSADAESEQKTPDCGPEVRRR